MDFFTLPTITFQVLHGFLVIAHDRRRILHFNVTASNLWITKPLREEFPVEAGTRYFIFERDAKYGLEVAGHGPRHGDESLRTS